MLQLECHCATFRQATRAITQLYDNRLRSCGLKITQFTILRTLNMHPQITRIADLTEALLIDNSTLTRSLSLMQTHGWIEAVADAQDRRERRLKLTRSGRALVAKAEPLWAMAQAEVAARLGKGDTRTAHDAAARLASSFTDMDS